MAAKIPTVKLNNGAEIPAFGLGTWKSKPGEVRAAVENAIDVGYRMIDCALAYQNENEVGQAIATKIKEGVVKREDLFVTGKLWNTFHRPDLVPIGIKKTLTDLGLDYVDLYLIHWPMGYKEDGELFPKDADGKFMYSDVDYLDTWKEMEACVRAGQAKAIGFSNFNSDQVERVLQKGTIKPAMLQVECHPYLNQSKLIEWCQGKDIPVTAYSPLGSPDRPWAKPTDPNLLTDPKLEAIAKKYGKSTAQIILRWNAQRGLIIIPKTVSKGRLEENMSIYDFKLTHEDMELINSFDCNGRGCHLDWVKDHKYWPFNTPF
jgi:aldehyde reductase